MKANISKLKLYFVTSEVFVYNQQMFRRQLQISINRKLIYFSTKFNAKAISGELFAVCDRIEKIKFC